MVVQMFAHLLKSENNYRVFRLAASAILLFICGCGDFFEKKTTETETRRMLEKLSQPREIPGVKNPLPEMYRSEPTRIRTGEQVKLFYFTKNHSVAELSKLVTEQMGNKVSTSTATNQLIVNCSGDEQADKVLEFLEKVDVPPIQVNIDCLVVEQFADVTLDWETTMVIEDFFGESITIGGKTNDAGEYLPTFPGASLRESKRSTFGLNIGYSDIDGDVVKVIVDILESRGYLKILMNPQVETINGQKAKITSRENVPLEKILLKEGFEEPFSLTEYQWVADTLEVTPYVYADGSIGLKTNVMIGSKSKPEGVVQVSVITERSIDIQENRIEPGDSLIVGGLRKSEKRSVIRGVPFLKDLPLVGILFSSKDFEEKATEIIFILTPSISSGGRPYEEALEEVRQMHKTPEYETGIEEAITDPFGSGVYSEQARERAAEAEFKRRIAEIEKAEAREDVEQIKKRLSELTEDIMREKAKAAKALEEAKKEKASAEIIKAEADKTKKEAQEAKEQMDKDKQEQNKQQSQKKDGQ